LMRFVRRSRHEAAPAALALCDEDGRRRLRRQAGPGALEDKIGRGGMLLGATNKLKYWDLYKDLFEVVSQFEPATSRTSSSRSWRARTSSRHRAPRPRRPAIKPRQVSNGQRCAVREPEGNLFLSAACVVGIARP
jgi:hypothetical protein